jgi:hypothetical protein
MTCEDTHVKRVNIDNNLQLAMVSWSTILQFVPKLTLDRFLFYEIFIFAIHNLRSCRFCSGVAGNVGKSNVGFLSLSAASGVVQVLCFHIVDLTEIKYHHERTTTSSQK